jgi:hypothetical protein
MQKALVVRYDLREGLMNHSSEQNRCLEELNRLLTDGWVVKSSYPMSGHSYNLASTSLVVVEK